MPDTIAITINPATDEVVIHHAQDVGVTAHAVLTGLEADDHPQYALADGSRGAFAPASGIPASAIGGTAVLTTDGRLSNERTPTAVGLASKVTSAGAAVPADADAIPVVESSGSLKKITISNLKVTLRTYFDAIYAAAAAYARTDIGQTFTGPQNFTGNVGITGNTNVAAVSETIVPLGVVGATPALAINAGTVITATLTASALSAFAMPTLAAGKSFTLLLNQAAAGNGTATFTAVKWSGGTAP